MTYLRQSGRRAIGFSRIINSDAILFTDLTHSATSEDSVADRMWFSPIEVPFKCRIDKLGIYTGGQMNSGNFILALYNSSPTTFLPTTVICQTASTAVAGKPASLLQFFAPTTTPTINAGLYWIAVIFSVVYSAGTTGGRVTYGNMMVTDSNLWNDAVDAWYYQNVGSFTVPSPATPVSWAHRYAMACGLRVTVT